MSSNLVKALTPQSSRAVAMIRESVAHPLFVRMSDIEIEIVWQAFSGSLCAGYLVVDNTTLNQFKEWLED